MTKSKTKGKTKIKSKSKSKSKIKNRGILTAVEGVAVKGYDMGKEVGEIGFEMDLIVAKITIVIGIIIIIGSIVASFIMREKNMLMLILFGVCIIFIGFISKTSTETMKNNSALKAVRGVQFAKNMILPRK